MVEQNHDSTTLRAGKTARITRRGNATTLLSDVRDAMSKDDSLAICVLALIELSKSYQSKKIISQQLEKMVDGGFIHFYSVVRKEEVLQRTLFRLLFKKSTAEILLLLRSLPEKFGVSAMEPKVLVLISERAQSLP